MIETAITLLRLLLGLGAVFFLGYAMLTLLIPRPRDFTGLSAPPSASGSASWPSPSGCWP